MIDMILCELVNVIVTLLIFTLISLIVYKLVKFDMTNFRLDDDETSE